MTAVLTAQGVVKRYCSRDILTGASLTLEAGTLTALLGRNGAGKSTLLRICAGWTAADSGVIMLDGEVWEGGRPHLLARRGLFYLPDRGILSHALTLRQQAQAVLRRYGGTAPRIEEVATRVRAETLLDRRPRTYSGGERRRAEITLTLLRAPRCLLADEPLRGIDPRDAETVLAGLRHLAEEGCAVVVTGHELPTLLAEADRVIGLAGGTTRTLHAGRGQPAPSPVPDRDGSPEGDTACTGGPFLSHAGGRAGVRPRRLSRSQASGTPGCFLWYGVGTPGARAAKFNGRGPVTAGNRTCVHVRPTSQHFPRTDSGAP